MEMNEILPAGVGLCRKPHPGTGKCPLADEGGWRDSGREGQDLPSAAGTAVLKLELTLGSARAQYEGSSGHTEGE